MMRLFRNPKGAVYGILVFVMALLLLFAIRARAEQTLAVEAGAAVLRGQTPAIGLTGACVQCGPVGTSWEYGFDLIGDSHDYADNPNVIQLRGQIVDGWRRAEIGLGFYWQNVETEYVCDFGFHLLARWRFANRLSAQWRHSSSAGSCRPNVGRDLLTVSYRF